MERPRVATVEVGPTEPMKKNFPDDRRVILLSSPKVEDEARCRISGDDEDVGPTSVEELAWSLDRPDLWLQNRGEGGGELRRKRVGAQIWRSGGRRRRI